MRHGIKTAKKSTKGTTNKRTKPGVRLGASIDERSLAQIAGGGGFPGEGRTIGEGIQGNPPNHLRNTPQPGPQSLTYPPATPSELENGQPNAPRTSLTNIAGRVGTAIVGIAGIVGTGFGIASYKRGH
jgi:hypothetical protein